MLEIIKVETKKQRKEFVEYPLRLYKNNEFFVPPLYGDEMKIFTAKNVYARTCKSAFWLAIRDGKTVGRIQGIIQYQYNEIHNTRQVRFTRFDSEDNQETANALFKAVEDWAKENEMDEVVGPLGYSDLEREGLLIEGFNYLSTFEEQYNYDYYGALVENSGYAKDVDWVEFRLFSSSMLDDRLTMLGERALLKHNLHIGGEGLSKRAYINKYAKGIFECIDECYKELYGVVPFTDEMRDQMVEQFRLILNKEYIVVVCDENENVVAFGFCLPGIGKAVQKSGGKLTPACLLRLLKAIKNPESIDLALVGIMPQYRKSGLSALMLIKMQNMLKTGKIEYMETNLNLETNANIQAQWRHFDYIQHKRRRSYIKKLN